MSAPTDVEVAIVGGGPAGLSAALMLGRSGRITRLFDAGPPRNAPAHAAHNVFTRDGTPPLELLRLGREQLAPYPSVQVRQARIDDAERLADGSFRLRAADGSTTTAGTVMLATGVVDLLPDIEGLRALWGTGVVHCPYCHGWEVRGRAFVLIGQRPDAVHLARILRGWSSDVTLCPTEALHVDAEERAGLADLGVRVRAPVRRIEGDGRGSVAAVTLTDGTRLGPCAVFTSAPVRQRSSLPEKLGCTVHTEGRSAGLVKVDERGFSGSPGVWVIGDASEGPSQVIAAAYEGALAAAMLNNELLLAGVLPRGGDAG